LLKGAEIVGFAPVAHEGVVTMTSLRGFHHAIPHGSFGAAASVARGDALASDGDADRRFVAG
jgi:hypothetical protein